MPPGKPIPDQFKPTPDEHRQALADIDEIYLGAAPPSSHPTLTIIIGQPGAGKTTVATAAMRDMAATGSAVHVDLDELRNFHPHFNEIRAEHGIYSSDVNHPEAVRYKDYLLDRAIGQKNNILFETTGNSAASLERVIAQAKAQGYEVNLNFIATNQELSRASIVSRYEHLLDLKDPRWVPLDYHDSNVANLPNVVNELARVSGIDHISVHYRDGTIVPGSEGGFSRAADALRREQTRPLTVDEQAAVGKLWDASLRNFGDPPDIHRPAEYRQLVREQRQAFLDRNPDSGNSTVAPPTEPPPAPTAPDPLLSATLEAPAAKVIANGGGHSPEGTPPLPAPATDPLTLARRSSIHIDAKLVGNTVSVGSAALGVLGVTQRVTSGQLNHDLHGNKTQAVAGSAAFLADAANATGGVTMAVVRLMPSASETMMGASRLAGRAALPLAVASTAFDVGAGLAEHDGGRVAGATGRLAGGIGGGMAFGALAGAALGLETGPGVVVTTVIGAIGGGILGEKAARALFDKGKDYFKNHSWFSSSAPPPSQTPPHASVLQPSSEIHVLETREASMVPPTPTNRRVKTPMHTVIAATEPAAAPHAKPSPQFAANDTKKKGPTATNATI